MLTHNNTNKSEWRVVLCTRVKLIISHKKYTLPLFTGDEISHMSDSKEETKEMMLLTIHVHIQGCVLGGNNPQTNDRHRFNLIEQYILKINPIVFFLKPTMGNTIIFKS